MFSQTKALYSYQKKKTKYIFKTGEENVHKADSRPNILISKHKKWFSSRLRSGLKYIWYTGNQWPR